MVSVVKPFQDLSNSPHYATLYYTLKMGVWPLQGFFEFTFWNNTVLDYLIFLGSYIASLIVLYIFKRIILNRLRKWAQKTATTLDDMLVDAVKKYLMPLLYIGALYFNAKWLTLSAGVQQVLDIAAIAFVIVIGAALLSSAAVITFNKYIEKKQKDSNKLALKWMGVLIKTIIWVCALLLFLDNLGVEITALIAGLGIGGIAVAFAAQAVLEDIFSFVTIFFDKPFELGDFIDVGGLMGTVENIGIKTTRIRSISGEQLVFSNKDLTSSRLRNYKRMQSRRATFTIHVKYDTPTEKLKEIPAIIKDIIESVPGTRFDRSHFGRFAEYSLAIETVYYVLSSDYNLYMDINQSINLAIKEAFEARGIEFALPAQTISIDKD